MNRDTATNARTPSDDDVLVRVEGVGKKFCCAPPIQRAFCITADQRVEMFKPEHFNTRSQDLEEAFHDAGQFYWGRAAAWLAGKPLFSHDAAPVLLPRHRVQDIDTAEDWERAQLMFAVIRQQDNS